MAVQYQLSGGTAAAISASVESGIRDGRLTPGEALPPVRTLAGELGVSPATVAAAYRTLRDRGLVETGGRAGTRVRGRPPVAARGTGRLHVPPGALDLATGVPDPAFLPELGPYLATVAHDLPQVGYPGGPLPELLEAAGDRGFPDGRLTVVGGALDGIERTLGAHLRPGDRVAVEDPGWTGVLDLVAALGLVPVPLPVDPAGPTEDGLRAALAAGAAAAIITSRAQNPTGAVVRAGRAQALRRIFRAYRHVLVIEDDHAAELSVEPAHPLVGVTDTWTYIRSVSKPYGCDLRLAVLAGDELTVPRIEGRQRLGTGWVSTVLQRLVLRLWADPAVTELVAAASAAYTARRTALREALGDVPSQGDSGLNVWIPVDDETSVVAGLREEGIVVVPGAYHRLVSPPAIRVTTASLPLSEAPRVADAIRRGVARSTRRSY